MAARNPLRRGGCRCIGGGGAHVAGQAQGDDQGFLPAALQSGSVAISKPYYAAGSLVASAVHLVEPLTLLAAVTV
jgi:hypothetical protein